MTTEHGPHPQSESGRAAWRLVLVSAAAWAAQTLSLLLSLRLASTYPATYFVYVVVLYGTLPVAMLPAAGLLRARRWGIGLLFVLLGCVAWGVAVWGSGMTAAVLSGGVGAGP